MPPRRAVIFAAMLLWLGGIEAIALALAKARFDRVANLGVVSAAIGAGIFVWLAWAAPASPLDLGARVVERSPATRTVLHGLLVLGALTFIAMVR